MVLTAADGSISYFVRPFWVGENSPRQTLPLAGFAITCLQCQLSLLLGAANFRLVLLASSRAIPQL
ncbi:MAG: hypothetical protein DCF15_12155 [Phormidesmis priestleyi]|uniref:Uncharacterized protein n=1 Tax=Phormidesmis priestleyi TaxID=268141 RepID=A0A2W4XAE4_9CYAN|nr:MAG: hypothetical protein DCF15_12155 [Phormidesmis priestleyi]